MTGKAAPAPSPYIINPRADLLLIVGAVVLCPALLLPAAQLTSPYTVWLIVMSFGAVGHHLPSFLRTYGDHDLFERYKARLIIAPVLLFAVTLAFSLKGLHGMLLVSMCWSIWHGMMQHFGFMRIYDVKVRSISPLTARLDWWISASWFGLCLAFSPNQGGSLLNALYESGIPLVPLSYIDGLRAALITQTVVVTILYIAHAVWSKQPRSWLKLSLLAGTFGYIWVVRVLTKDPFLSVALFELLHDMQYLAIVWAFNRRLAEKGSTGVLPKFFYMPRAVSVAGYIGACLAYGALGLTVYTQLSSGLFKQIMEAFLITSGLLHFYYDGFIWKLRQSDTQRGLGLEAKTGTYRPAWNGLGHTAILGIPIIMLAWTEMKVGPPSELDRSRSILAAVPDNVTAMSKYGIELTKQERYEEAVPYLRKALSMQPNMTEVRDSLSDSLAVLSHFTANQGRLTEAIALAEEALSIEPDSPDRLNTLAVFLANAGRTSEAEQHLRRALAIDPEYTQAMDNLQAIQASSVR